MNPFQAIVLGLVQGLGEFFPISSSGHLILVPWLLGWKEHGLSFDVMLHAGTLFAVAAYFWKDWIVLLREGFLSVKQRSLSGPPERKLFWFIVAASVPGAIIGKLFEEQAEQAFRAPLVVASAMGIFALLLYILDRFGRKARDLRSLNIIDAVLIGLSQAAAIIPGVSRSGATIGCGLGLGINRESSAKFSFLLAAPIIFGAAVLKAGDIMRTAITGQGIAFLLGFTVSAVTGLLAIHYLLRFLRNHSFTVFVVYRVIFCLTVFSVYFMRIAR